MSSSMFLFNKYEFDRKREVLNMKISKWRVKEKRCLQSLIETTDFFCLNTTLHGFRNIYELVLEYKYCTTRTQRFLKLLSITVWLSFLFLGLGFATVLISYFWQRFQNTPTITTIETNNYPIWNVDFPAVTICNVNKVYQPATSNITQKLFERGIPTSEIDFFLRNLSKLVQPEYTKDLFEKTYTVLDDLGYKTDTLMKEIMHPCDIMLDKCSWLGKFVPCDSIFRIAKSSEGYCCSFNYDAIKDNLEIDSDKISDELKNPKFRVSGAGPYVGMELLVNIQPEHYMAYTRTFYGVSILIHSPREYPQNAVAKTVGQIGTDVKINVVPSVVVSEESVKSLPLIQRNCYFNDEITLRTTTSYSYSTCTNECAVDTIYRMCNCIPFYYVDTQLFANITNIRQCTLRDVNCLRDNRHIFSSLQPESVLNETIGLNCSICRPGCSEVRYDIQTTVAQRLSEAQLRSLHFDDSVTLTDFVTIKIHFKDITCLKYRRDIFLTWDSMFASCGGIYSLCLGGSVISIIELIWIYTVKLYRISNEPPKDRKPQLSVRRKTEIGTLKLSMKHQHGSIIKKPKIQRVDRVSQKWLQESVRH